MNDTLTGLLISYAYLFGVLLTAEWIRSRWHLPSEFTRKAVHIGVGFWGFIAWALLDAVWAAFLVPASFILVNAVSYKKALFKSMEIEDRSNLGTIYYPVSLSLLVLLFWRDARLAVLTGLMAMALGDGMASIVGRRVGRHAYRIGSASKTAEGSAAMALFTFLAVGAVLFFLADLPVSQVLMRALAMAVLAAAVEGVSPRGTDNLGVPLACGTVYAFLFSS